ncbi:MAG: cadherin-like domain-containing protein, partial [Thiolinea sp.]
MQANSSRLGKKIPKYILFINLLFIPLTIQAYIPPELSLAIQNANDEPIDSMDFQTIFVGKLSTKTIRFKNESTHSLIKVSNLELGSCRPTGLPAGKITKHRAISIENQPYSVASPGLSLPIAISASSFEEVNLVFSPQNAGDFNADLCISYELLDGPTGELIGSSITYMTLSGTGAKLNTDENKFSLAEDDPLTQITTATILFNNDENLAAHFKIERVEAIQGGSVVLNANQTISFEPNANYNGAASFKYVVKDDAGNEASAVVTGTISAVNDPPVLKPSPPNMSGSTPEDTALTIPATNLLTNFTDPDGGDTLS